MSARELVLLGTGAQTPTRRRNQNGYLLRWDGETVLFDPGEGTQRQLVLAGVPVSAVTRICITHLHGDHCLGLPGVVQRLSLDRVAHPVDVYFPASGLPYVERLRTASAFHDTAQLRLHPVEPGEVAVVAGCSLRAEWLDHRVDTLGWQLVEPDGRRMLPDRLAAAGVHGPDVGRLQREGRLRAGERWVALEDVSEPRPGQRFALVMDTRPCEGAGRLAAGADLLVCESTYLDEHAHLADEYRHMTASRAAGLAAGAGARRLVLTHFSERYADDDGFRAEAAAVFGDVTVGEDLMTVPVPPRD